MAMPMHSLEMLNTSDRDTFVAALGHIVEHGLWVAERVLRARPFATVADLHRAMQQCSGSGQ